MGSQRSSPPSDEPVTFGNSNDMKPVLPDLGSFEFDCAGKNWFGGFQTPAFYRLIG